MDKAEEKYGFTVEWFDNQAAMVREYTLTFYPRTQQIEMVIRFWCRLLQFYWYFVYSMTPKTRKCFWSFCITRLFALRICSLDPPSLCASFSLCIRITYSPLVCSDTLDSLILLTTQMRPLAGSSRRLVAGGLSVLFYCALHFLCVIL